MQDDFSTEGKKIKTRLFKLKKDEAKNLIKEYLVNNVEIYKEIMSEICDDYRDISDEVFLDGQGEINIDFFKNIKDETLKNKVMSMAFGFLYKNKKKYFKNITQQYDNLKTIEAAKQIPSKVNEYIHTQDTINSYKFINYFYALIDLLHNCIKLSHNEINQCLSIMQKSSLLIFLNSNEAIIKNPSFLDEKLLEIPECMIFNLETFKSKTFELESENIMKRGFYQFISNSLVNYMETGKIKHYKDALKSLISAIKKEPCKWCNPTKSNDKKLQHPCKDCKMLVSGISDITSLKKDTINKNLNNLNTVKERKEYLKEILRNCNQNTIKELIDYIDFVFDEFI